MLAPIIILLGFITCVLYFYWISTCELAKISVPDAKIPVPAAKIPVPDAKIPVSVNYHFTRKCNYECGFCFHTAKNSYKVPLDDAKRGLKLLARAGMKKLNFAGGEPFLYPKFLGTLLKYCKEDLKLESVSIVTNASLVRPEFMRDFGRYIDILAVSCDSFDEATNVKIGRGKGDHIKNLLPLKQLCVQHGIKFKLNTVINKYNFFEDMNEAISRLDPFRWKVFQVLVVEDENNSDKTLRNANRFTITDEEFSQFCTRHEHQKSFVPESNAVMESSYLILDEYMRFLNKNVKGPTASILDIGVEAAMDDVYWDEASFDRRGGIYDWTKAAKEGSSSSALELDW